MKGEGLAGTISNTEESSAAEASLSNSSTSPSRASTPPTSASDSSDDSDSDTSSTSSEESDLDLDIAVNEGNMADTEVKPSLRGLSREEKKRKRAEERAPAVRKRRREEQRVKIREATIRNREREREEAIANGTYDEKKEKEVETMKRIDRQVSWRIKEREKSGEFGVVLPKVQGRRKGDPNARVPDLERPGKTMSYKTAKQQREKNARAAKKELKKQMVVDAILKGELPNPDNYGREDLLKYYDRYMRYRQKEQKLSTDEKKAIRKQHREELKANKIATERARHEEKQRIKQEAREKQKQAEEAEAQNAEEKEKAALSRKIAKLSEEERAQYEERATSKSQTLEEYVRRRMQKKAEKKAQEDAPLPFFTDTEGDKTIVTKYIPQYELLPDGGIPIDPIVWTGRPIKSLTKEEREARRQWLEQRRNEKKVARAIAQGRNPDSIIKKGKTRVQKKMENLQRLTGKVLLEQGIESGADKQQIAEARRKAKGILRQEKRERKHGDKHKLVLTMKGRHRVSARAKARNAAAAAAAVAA